MRSPLSFQSPRARQMPRGVTIVEILVVIGVIAILMSLLLPAVGAVRRNSRAVACASNMRQIGIAHQMYMSFNREWFVNYGLRHGSSSPDLRRSWLMQLSPYIDGQAALRSPVDRSRYWSIDEEGEHPGLTLAKAIAEVQQNPGATLPNSQVSRWSSYAVNILLTDEFNGEPVVLPSGEIMEQKWQRLPLVPRPEMTVHFLMLTPGDGVGSSEFARTDHLDIDAWLGAPNEDLVLGRAARESHMSAHGGRLGSWTAVSNYLYLDGRVETHSFNVVYENADRNRFLPIAVPSN